ncbi:MAG: DUF1254 domain-containing protein [Candidatus Solibacter usitatus]|nr:DUF1254 domain-containing protein [Candidatus Solibacter usitatus]
MLKQFERIGFRPGGSFQVETLDAATTRGLSRGIEAGRRIVANGIFTRSVAVPRNGWIYSDIRPWGVDYMRRATTALGGLGALDPEEAIYLSANRDAAGQPLNGKQNYVLRFAKGQTPPAGAFWSVTLYDDNRFLVDNPIHRYAIGDRTKGLRTNPDGSLEIRIQSGRPESGESNWLPAPEGVFTLALRLYLPKPEAADGRWQPPALKIQ